MYEATESACSNEVLTLVDVAGRLGVQRARPERRALSWLRRLEESSGRRILVTTGHGARRRYLVLGRELEAALAGERREIDAIANRVASAVQALRDEMTAVSAKVDAAVRQCGTYAKRVEELERRGQTRLML